MNAIKVILLSSFLIFSPLSYSQDSDLNDDQTDTSVNNLEKAQENNQEEASGDDLQMLSLEENARKNVDHPERGLSMEEVEAYLGEPLERLTAIGSPPITRWYYESFTVYFENDKVIHSVNHPN